MNRKISRCIAVRILFVVFLILYPLRHITWGLDFMDTGYNYANFQYMGTEHMDSMWLFATYLATAVGNFLTRLPFGETLVGMNFYTGLFISFLAVCSYIFCVTKLKIKPWIAFLGEVTAISLCWCPTALLYNYLTYALLLVCVIFLYLGLLEKKPGYLLAAGICLGTNVLVRFSNLPQAALIMAVWAYAVIDGIENRKIGKKPNIFLRAFKDTLWCMAGYLAALILLLGYIHIRYGIDSYIEGIRRLFAMTDVAVGYKETFMIRSVIQAFRNQMVWVKEMVKAAACGLIFFGVIRIITEKISFIRNNEKAVSGFRVGSRVLFALATVLMIAGFYRCGLCNFTFNGYNAVHGPATLFLLVTMLIAIVCIFHRRSSGQERLISGIILLVVLISSVGSNNGVFTSFNNVFLAAPYVLQQSYRFCKTAGDYRLKGRLKWLVLTSEPFKWVLTGFLAMLLFQSVMFGICFAFMEGRGVEDISARVEHNDTLQGIRMSPERAEWMTEISVYVEEHNLTGREVILYGYIPGLSFYLKMPSAFNPWSDLLSYRPDAMEKAIRQTEMEIENGGLRPIIIVESSYWSNLTESWNIDEVTSDEKEILLLKFMERLSYRKTFINEKFVIWE